ncbi:MAG: PepSY-associated TM helix domain-containing protein [Opitutaceae bacterium]|nr:PepSY-associated TM helix domain-containing protein [Opitutaceae bacterium]
MNPAEKTPAPASPRPARWRAWFRILHRDLGYLFFGVTVVYAVSGLAVNHRANWNPNYRVERRQFALPPPAPGADAAGVSEKNYTKADISALLAGAGVKGRYKKHYAPDARHVRVFLDNGTATLDCEARLLDIELLHRRPLLHTFNKLHLNPGRWWLWFADAFAIALLTIAVTGIFLLRGKHGITRRGGALMLAGIAVPAVLVWLNL